MSDMISLTPGFSSVITGQNDNNRFNGFPRTGKPLKRLSRAEALTPG